MALTAFDTKKKSPTNALGAYNWNALPNPQPGNPMAGTAPTGNTPLDLNLSEGNAPGWRLNNWRLQYDAMPWLQDNIKFAHSLQPDKQNAILNLIRNLKDTKGNSAAYRADQMRQAPERGMDMARQLSLSNPAAAASLSAGAMRDAGNQAADDSASYDAFLQGPQGQSQSLQAILQAITGAYDQNAMNAYQGTTQGAISVEELNRALNPKKKGSLLGSLLGAGIGLATGGGGGWEQILGLLSGGGGGDLQSISQYA